MKRRTGGQDVSDDITAVATEDGDVRLTIIVGGKPFQFTLSIDAAQKLEAQVKTALIMARVRARGP
jgi:hypothetical protein